MEPSNSHTDLHPDIHSYQREPHNNLHSPEIMHAPLGNKLRMFAAICSHDVFFAGLPQYKMQCVNVVSFFLPLIYWEAV